MALLVDVMSKAISARAGMRPCPLEPEDLYRFRFAERVRLNPSADLVAYQLGWADEATCANATRIVVVRGEDREIVFESSAYARASSPDWSSKGELVFLGHTDRAGLDVCVFHPTTKETTVVARLDRPTAEPKWSPGGDRIALLAGALVDPDAAVPASHPAIIDREPVARVVRRLDFRRDDIGYLDGRARQLVTIARSGGALTTVAPGSWRVSAYAWRPDGRGLAFLGDDGPDSDLAEAMTLRFADEFGNISEIATAPAFHLPVWSPDGRWIAYLAPAEGAHEAEDNTSGSFVRVWVMSPDGSERRCLTLDFDRNAANTVLTDLWAAPQARLVWASDSQSLYFVAAGPGNAGIWHIGMDGQIACHHETDDRTIYDFDLVGETTAYCDCSAVDPSNVFLLRGTRAAALSDLNPWLSERALVSPRRLTFAADDGHPLDGWILRPPTLLADESSPLILEIHGGPFLQFGAAFSFEMQVLAGRGYQVLYTNPRASDGYGEAFRRQRYGLALSEKVYDDLMRALDQTIAMTGLVDACKLGVAGGSFGGYMTNFVICRTGRFAAAAACRSVSDTLSELGTCDLTGRWMLEGDTPWESSESLLARSPIAMADRITTPLLLTHGEMDFRATISQSEQLFGALRLLGRTVELVRFPGESHELARSGRPDRRIERLRRIADWFDRYLR